MEDQQQPGFVEQVQAQKDKQVQDLKHQQLVDGHAHTSNTVIAGAKAIIQHQEGVVESMQKVSDAIQSKVFDSNTLKSTLTDFGQKLDAFLKAIPNLPEPPEPVEDVKINNLGELEPHFKAIQKTLDKIAKLEVKPEVNVAAPKIDLKPLTTLLGAIKSGVDNLSKSEVKEDNTDLLAAINATTDAISSMRFPTANFMLPFKDSSGKDAQVTLDSSGNLPVNVSSATVSGTKSNNVGAPGATNLGVLPAVANAGAPSLTEGNQVALSTDLSGAVRVTGSLSVGGTTDNSAYIAGTSTGTPAMGFYHSTIDTVTDGRAAALAIDSKRNLLSVIRDAAGNARGANVTAGNALVVDGSAATQPVSNTGTFAVQATEADGANTTLGAKADAKSTATDTTAVSAMSVLKQISASVQAPPSQAVTNAGTFATQATLAAETTKVIGTVNQGTSPWVTSNATTSVVGNGTSATAQRVTLASDSTGQVTLATGANTIGALTANQSVNNAQINGVTPLMGNGASGTGAQRVTMASDSTGQIAPAANATATGASIYNNTALSSTKQAVNASAGNLYGYHIYNPNSVVIYIQLWNIASASVTVGTTAPTAVLAVPAGGWADAPPSGPPITFGTALTIAATTTATGSGTPSTALLCNIWYK